MAKTEYEVSFTLTASPRLEDWRYPDTQAHYYTLIRAGDYYCVPKSASFTVTPDESPLPLGTIVTYAREGSADIMPLRIKSSRDPENGWQYLDGWNPPERSILESDEAVMRDVHARIAYRPDSNVNTATWRIRFTVSSEFDPAHDSRGEWIEWDDGTGRKRLDPGLAEPYVIVPGDAEIKQIKALTDGVYAVRDQDDRWVTHRRVRSSVDRTMTVWQRLDDDGQWRAARIIADSNERDMETRRIGDLPPGVTTASD